MRQHRRVSSLRKLGDQMYELERSVGDKLRTFACECYSFGFAEYMETTRNFGRFDVIYINSAWCGYTMDAKQACRADKVGLFQMGSLMAALKKKDYWAYLDTDEKEYFEKEGWM